MLLKGASHMVGAFEHNQPEIGLEMMLMSLHGIPLDHIAVLCKPFPRLRNFFVLNPTQFILEIKFSCTSCSTVLASELLE